jgi:hypothetical protein
LEEVFVTRVNLIADYAVHRDTEAFAQIVNQYQCLILATCRRKLHDRADVHSHLHHG